MLQLRPQKLASRHSSAKFLSAAAFLVLVAFVPTLPAADEPRPAQPLSAEAWQSPLRSIAGLKGQHRAAVGFPAKQASKLTFVGAHDLAPGLYRLRLNVRASHVNDEIAWNGALVVKAGDQTVGKFPAIDFARRQEPELRTVDFVHSRLGPLKLELAAVIPPEVFERVTIRGQLDPKGEKSPDAKEAKEPAGGEDDLLAELTVSLKPATHFFVVLNSAEIEPLSHSAVVSSVAIDKVRYAPGETLKGTAVVQAVGASGGEVTGKLLISLENGLAERTQVKELPVSVSGKQPATIKFEIPLPEEELGYALIAEFVSPDGHDRSSAAEYFTVLDNFARVSIWGGLGAGHGGTFRPVEEMQKACRELRSSYVNAVEQFAWAEEDMVEMSPDTDVWYSGQTCYRLNKAGLQRLIGAAHEQGIAMTTYGKFVMSGYLGWNTAWDYPQDHKGQFVFPVGMWEGCNVQLNDRFRFKEFIPYEHGVPTGGLLKPFWQAFLPINPDPTPRMTRIAAEETLRSIEMFDWDGIRWDGHMRGGGPTGGSGGEFSFAAARKTQTLVRYFKDIIAAKQPQFRHGYNYLFVQEKPNYDWAVDDFELDELCRDGGLLMNESIGNTTAGKPFGWLAQNIQVEGDLARERGGYLLGISYADNPRDQLVESILYFAGGCRPMQGAARLPLINRYGTRFAKYTFDETLRRLAQPEKVLQPAAKTDLWWQPFVYETQRTDGKSQLVVNLIHIPQNAVTRGGETNRPIDWSMPAGTAPIDFRLTLPKGYRATDAHVIDPFSLAVAPLALKDGQFQAPAVDTWQVVIVDLEATAATKTLAAQFGPPATFQVPRPDLKEPRIDEVVLDVDEPLAAAEQAFAAAFGTGNDAFAEDSKLAALADKERNAELLRRKALPENSADAFINGWWKGGSLPADQALQAKPPQFGNLAPRRDGVADVFVARGAMSHRLHLDAGLAGLPSSRLADATLGGFSVNYGLRRNIGPAQLPRFDLLVYADIPHGAIGSEMGYALVDYVKSGGGVFFTGGQYSFGKGGYAWSVLDRELLPVQIVKNLDTRISAEPLPLEPGPDFADLGVSVDWKQRPSIYVFNEVAVRPDAGAKIFLKSGNRPILVGWELGQGRVTCLLATPMGQSTEDAPLYSEWSDWPALLAATMKWTSPAAGESSKNAPSATAIAAVVKDLGRAKSDGALDDLLEGGGPLTPVLDVAPEGLGGKNVAKGLDEKTLAKRLAQIETLLSAPNPEARRILAEQVTTVPNLPEELRWRILEALRRGHASSKADGEVAGELAKLALAGVRNPDLRLHTAGLALWAVSGSPDYAQYVRAGIDALDGDRIGKQRALALSLPFYGEPDLLDFGKTQLAKWAQTEADRMKAYTGGRDFTLAAPPAPLLDSETLALRAGWLAYLTSLQPAEFAAQFAHEWAMLGQYIEYCDVTEAGLWAETQNATPAKRGKIKADVGLVHEYRATLESLQSVCLPRLESLLKTQPSAVAQGFSNLHFQHAALAAIKLLANAREATAELIGILEKQTDNPLLKEFAAARAVDSGR